MLYIKDVKRGKHLLQTTSHYKTGWNYALCLQGNKLDLDA